MLIQIPAKSGWVEVYDTSLSSTHNTPPDFYLMSQGGRWRYSNTLFTPLWLYYQQIHIRMGLFTPLFSPIS